ncbi:MAG TPA: hypothetical protein VND93_33110 [Myxococcales bacterium]|nr:hypothetical protein [Myxococcales bacterium]
MAPFPVALVPSEVPTSKLGRWTDWKETTKGDLESLRARVRDSVLDVASCELEDLLDRMDTPHRHLEAEAQRLGPRIRWRPDPMARLTPIPAPAPGKAPRLMLLHSDDLRGAKAARALEQALHSRGVEPRTRELYPELGVFFQAFWRGLWARCAAAGFDFNDVLAFDRIHNEGRLLGVVNRLGARSLSPRMRQQIQESAAVVTCDPFAGQFISYLRRVYSVPVAHHAVELDRAVSSLLYPAGCDAWYVPDAAVRATLVAAGEPEDVVQDAGVPVARELEGLPAKASPRELLVLGRVAPGTFPMHGLLDSLRARGVPDCKVVYACAKGEDVDVPAPGVQVIWYSDQQPLLLKRASIAIIPPDGLSLAEALAAGAVPILTPPRGEAERANARFAESAGVGLNARTADEAWEHAEWLLREPEELAVRASRCLRCAAPDAARVIAARLVKG